MRNFNKIKPWIRLVVFLFGIVVINEILTFLLVPAGQFSRWVQHDAVEPENTYQLITFGASESLRTWDSQTADEILGIKTYNMGGSAISLEGGIYANFIDTMEHQSPDRVILIMGRYEMGGYKEPAKSYIAVAPYLSNQKNAWSYFMRLMMDGEALKRAFPWTEYRVEIFGGLSSNIKDKMSEEYLEYDVSFLPDDRLHYEGQGFCPLITEEAISYDNVNENHQNAFVSKDIIFKDEKIDTLIKIINYAQERDCEVIILAAPIPVTSVAFYKYYNSQSVQLKEIAELYGAQYYDFNMAKPELWEPQLDDFYDETHVNEKGAERYTISVCNLLQKLDAGEDVSNLFYSDWDEYVASIDYVVTTYMEVEETETDVCAQAFIVSGGETVPEYKFVLHNLEDDTEQVLQEFSENDIIQINKEKFNNENIVLRVYARAVGEDDSNKVRYFDYPSSGEEVK